MSASRPSIGLVDGLAQLSFLVQGLLGRRASEHGLSVIQTRLLGVLRDRAPSINELAQLLELDKSSVSGLVDRAVRRGLVSRTPSTRDRRGVHVQLTPAGHDLADAVSAQLATDVAGLLEDLPAGDRRDLAAVVSRILITHAHVAGVDLFATDQASPS